jgi:hypothetical protein
MLAACSKHEAPVEPVRPVKLARVSIGRHRRRDRVRRRGEGAPRIGARFPHRRQDRRSPRGRRRACEKARRSRASTRPTSRCRRKPRRRPVAAAQTEHEFAKAEFDRYDNLYRQKFVSGSALDQKRNVMNANAAKLEQAQAATRGREQPGRYATLVADRTAS